MKRLFAVLFIIVLFSAFAGCLEKSESGNPSDDNATENTTIENTSDYTIKWGQAPDKSLLGAWKSLDISDSKDIFIFTDDYKLVYTSGTVSYECDVDYGVDGMGNVSVCVFGRYLSDTWTFEVEDDVLTINRPKYNDNDEFDGYDTFKFESVNYEKPQLEVYDNFTADEKLLGEWTNAETGDFYQFTEDGRAVIAFDTPLEVEGEDELRIATDSIDAVYTVSEDSVSLKFINIDGKEESVTFKYTIDGTKITFDGASPAYLNGEGDPYIEAQNNN